MLISQYHLYEYKELELLTELSFKSFDIPIKLLGDIVYNIDPDSNNLGWLAGFTIGEITDRNTWKLRYNYRKLEKDAVYANFTDSNFGNGGTDSQGHELGLSIGLSKNIKASISYFKNDVQLEEKATYQRLIFDISSTF